MSAKSQGNSTSQPHPAPLHLRVFLASPGDVVDERALAVRVLSGLPSDPLLRGKITLEAVAWDHPDTKTPFLAGMSAQDAVIRSLGKLSACDIVVVILWSQLGSPIKQKQYAKPDGSGYFSGTEWEYENAWQAYRKDGKPLILIYHRTSNPDAQLNPSNRKAILERLDQLESVATFLSACHQRDGSIPNEYQTPSEFEENLRNHLKEQIRDILEPRGMPQQVSVVVLPTVWQGSPFPGLRPFTDKDEPIFFGRGRETDGLIRKLVDPANRFVTIVGASGSGKSSLVWAGLIPRLQAGALEGSQDWAWGRFTPGEAGDNPFIALAMAFKDALQQRGQQPPELADRLGKNPATLVELRDLVLAGKPDGAELLLFIDQFEELFTLAKPAYLSSFIGLLEQAARTERISVVATLRADFYHRCVEQLPLAELLRSGSYPLAAPGPGALHEMITRPAERAGLTFEAGLVERMLDDTGSEPGALALLAFALAELYAAKTADGTLTQVAYDGFGGVKGAIGQRAEDAVHRLGVTLKTVGEVFQGLLEIGEGKAVTRRALWARLVKSGEAEKLVTAFINARLLVASRSEAGQAVVEVAHEALFTAWQRLCTWVDTHRKQLKAGQDLEKAAREWHDIGEPRSGLASGARLKHYRQAIDPSALASRFLRASRRRLWIFRTLKVSAATLVLAIVAWFLITFVTSVQIIRVVGNSYGGLRKDLEIFNSTVGSEWPWHRAELVDDWNTKDTNARFDIAMQVLRGDIEADVIELDGIWLPSFIDNNPPFLESLNKWYGTDFEDRFWKQSLEVARPVGTAPSVCRDQDGKDTQCLYAIPLYVDVGLLFYRSDLLPGLQSNPKPQQDCQCDKVEIPRIQLDNLLEQVRKAVKDYPHPGLEGLVFQSTEYEGLNCMFFELLALELAREGEPISTLAPDKIYTDNCETSPPTCPGYKALERMHSWIYSEKHVVPSSTLVFREEESRFLFTYGKAVLLRNWPYVLQQKWPEGNPVTKDKVGVVQLKDGKPILGGWYLGIPSRAKHKDDAWQLIKFLADRDSNDQDLMLNRPRIPADQEILKKVLKDKYEKKDEKNESCLCLFSKGIQSALEQAMVRPKLVGYPEASKDIAKALHKVLVNPNAGDSAMKEALKDAQEALNKAPDKFKKFMWCDLRLMDPPYDKTEKEIIDNFEIKFKSKIQECAVLIVRATSDSEKWTVAGFNDEGKFRTVVIDDPSHELSKELKKEPINKIRIVELALSSLGRTLPPRI